MLANVLTFSKLHARQFVSQLSGLTNPRSALIFQRLTAPKMIRNRERTPLLAEGLDLTIFYKSFTSSIVICLLFLLLALVGYLLASVQRTRRCFLPSAALNPRSANTMSNSTEEKSFPPPTPESILTEPELPDPLAGVYFPITSAQLVVLADKRTREAEEKRARGEDPDPVEPAGDLSQFNDRLVAYIRYFQDQDNEEIWQRRIVHYEPSNQSAT